jgi:hypothetical protein
MQFINLCLNVPNLETIVFYVIFVILIPGYLFSTSDYEALKYYLPALVMISVTLTEAGKPDLFASLYPNPCDNNSSFAGYLSTNIINGLAVVGILTQSLVITMATSSITLGLVSGLITFAIAFPMAQQILPFFIQEVKDLVSNPNVFDSNVRFPGNWHLYFAGLIFSILLLLVQYVMLIGFTKYILSTGVKLI